MKQLSRRVLAAPVFMGLGLAAMVALPGFAQDAAAPAQPAAAATATDQYEPATSTSEPAPLAARSLILDIADGGDRAIAVGERGHILVSETRRGDWRQVENVPTRSNLTGVAAIGNSAWAVGHDGVILASTDGGLSWTRQRVQPFDPDVDELHNGVPLLDVWFADAQHGFAVGAYALLLRTDDGGATWTQVDLGGGGGDDVADEEIVDEEIVEEDVADDGAASEDDESWTFDDSELVLEDETDPHLNGIARTGDGSLVIVGERGTAYRSTDGGTTWARLKMPYGGSMFGVIGFDGRHVLAYGLRGHVYESTDLGDNWTEVETGTDLSLMGGTGLAGGGAVLVGANGIILTRSGTGTGLLAHSHPDGAVLSSVVALTPNGGDLIVAGENGVSLFQLTKP